MRIIEKTRTIHVTGIELRTSNEQAMQTIPSHWTRFTSEGIQAQVVGKLSDDVFAVYTDFENAGRDNRGLYSLVIGVPVPADAAIPAGMVRVTVPASRRAVFDVEKGRFDLVGAVWQEIWATGLPKTYVADYEHYRADGEIGIFIGIEREVAAA